MLINTLLLVVSFYILMGLERISRNHMKQVILVALKEVSVKFPVYMISIWNYFWQTQDLFKYSFNTC